MAHGLTQAQVASAANVSRTTVNRLEHGLITDLGVRKVQSILEQVGMVLAVRELETQERADYVRMACTTANVSFKTALTEDELINALLSGKAPTRKRPHLRALLDEGRPALLGGLVEEVRRWSKPGRLEKNLARLAREVGSTRDINSWLKTG